MVDDALLRLSHAMAADRSRPDVLGSKIHKLTLIGLLIDAGTRFRKANKSRSNLRAMKVQITGAVRAYASRASTLKIIGNFFARSKSSLAPHVDPPTASSGRNLRGQLVGLAQGPNGGLVISPGHYRSTTKFTPVDVTGADHVVVAPAGSVVLWRADIVHANASAGHTLPLLPDPDSYTISMPDVAANVSAVHAMVAARGAAVITGVLTAAQVDDFVAAAKTAVRASRGAVGQKFKGSQNHLWKRYGVSVHQSLRQFHLAARGLWQLLLGGGRCDLFPRRACVCDA